ncbi:BTB/POZ protein [Rhizophagus irregularis DAOM 181602=DAOM 197198]|nr:BTB/POZ protein [Rhizophagus irregularis DAOM 181602=DAOM 197198]
MVRNVYFQKLSQNLLEILDDEEYYDVTIEVVAASELGLQELIPNIQLFLIKSKTNWIEQNFNLIYRTSFENNSFSELQNFCTELMSKQPEKIFNSPDFTSISGKSLISLIQLDNVQMSEVKIWEHVLKWGIAQNPELSSDSSNYSNDDFNALKNTVQQIIPFIKFTEFTSKEFLNKVYPYKKIIPEEIHENLIKCFLDNDYKPSKKSVPQTIKETKEIVKSSEEILGGYNPIMWKSKMCSKAFSNEYSKTTDSFIFSFNNKKDIKNHILSRVKDEKYAINNSLYDGPSFGRGDLTIYGDLLNPEYSFSNCSNYCINKSYEKQIREAEVDFAVEEYEVFQIYIG